MAAHPVRERVRPLRRARVATSLVGLAAGGAVVVVALLVGAPPWLAGVLGVAALAACLVAVFPRRPRRARIDPFTLKDPWRRFVQHALQARSRFTRAVDQAPPGPLHDRLTEIGRRMDAAVDECWLVAQRGEALTTARKGIDVPTGEGAAAGDAAGAGDPPGDAAGAGDDTVARAREVQRATAHRLDELTARAERELRVLDARLDEAVARTLELAAQGHAGIDGGVAGLGSDMDGLVLEMEALRLALEETAGPALPAGDDGPQPGRPGDGAPRTGPA